MRELEARRSPAYCGSISTQKDDELQEISWADFFGKFEKEKLAFLYQDRTADGSVSRFHKFVQR